jgi:hypothetical protein
MIHFYDRAGDPITRERWSVLTRDDSYRRVDMTTLKFGETLVMVSTVWLGIDHSFGVPGMPISIFETMVFDGPRDGDQYRYATEDEARAGHAEVVAELSIERDNAMQWSDNTEA